MAHLNALHSARRFHPALQRHCHSRNSATRYCHERSTWTSLHHGGFVAMIVTSIVTFSSAAPAWASNDAILSKLGQLQDEQISKEIASPLISRLSRVQAAREQFSRVSRLVQLKQFNSARLQLREGAASTLRKDLRDAQDLYITEEMATASITALEQLDAALRAQDTTLCTQQLELLQKTLQQVIDALGAPTQTP